MGVKILKSAQKGGPIVRADARSLRLVQRFVQALDFDAVEPLVPNLQPRAEGFGRP